MRHVVPVLVLVAACLPPPGERVVVIIPPQWACGTRLEEHTTRCPCAVPEDLAQLEDRPEVSTLRLTVHEPLDFAALARLTHLTTLIVQAPRPLDLSGMSKLTQIRDLTVIAPALDLAPIAEMRRLERLVWRRDDPQAKAPVPRVDVTPLRGLSALRDLDLQFAEVADVRPLAGLIQLERLGLRCGPRVDLSPLQTLAALRELVLLGAPARDLGVLASLKSLRVLHLGPAYPHVSCRDFGQTDREIDAPLQRQLGGVAIRHEGDPCSIDLCTLNPSGCPVIDSCKDRPSTHRE
jgi:hypothetical protein